MNLKDLEALIIEMYTPLLKERIFEKLTCRQCQNLFPSQDSGLCVKCEDKSFDLETDEPRGD